MNVSVTGAAAALGGLDLPVGSGAGLSNTTGFQPASADPGAPQGGGTSLIGFQVLFSEGPVDPSQGFRLTVRGDGFFQLETPQGVRFTRGGGFHVGAGGDLVSSQGLPVTPPVQVPADAQSILVTDDGRVLALLQNGSVVQVGVIELATVPNPGALVQAGGAVYAPSAASGAPQPGATGRIQFGALGGSAGGLGLGSLESLPLRGAVGAQFRGGEDPGAPPRALSWTSWVELERGNPRRS